MGEPHVGVIFFFSSLFQQGDTSPLPPTVPDCLRADVRVAPSESQNCSFSLADKNITHGFLYPPGLYNFFFRAAA